MNTSNRNYCSHWHVICSFEISFSIYRCNLLVDGFINNALETRGFRAERRGGWGGGEGYGEKKGRKEPRWLSIWLGLYWQFIKLNVTRERESTWNVNKTRNRFDLNYAITFLTRALSLSLSLSLNQRKIEIDYYFSSWKLTRAFHASVWSRSRPLDSSRFLHLSIPRHFVHYQTA